MDEAMRQSLAGAARGGGVAEPSGGGVSAGRAAADPGGGGRPGGAGGGAAGDHRRGRDAAQRAPRTPARAANGAEDVLGPRGRAARRLAGRPGCARCSTSPAWSSTPTWAGLRSAEAAVEQVAQVARSYCNLEYDLEAGARGNRETHVEALLTRLTGAEAAFAVNNNAGAVLLLLMALAAGREVVVSRGQLVEIGGSFRLPDIMRAGGVAPGRGGHHQPHPHRRLRSRHHARHGHAAAGAHLQLPHHGVHRGGGAGRAGGVGPAARASSWPTTWAAAPCTNSTPTGASPPWPASLRAGVDVVCFSGDKLLGGPQAGILAGHAARSSTGCASTRWPARSASGQDDPGRPRGHAPRSTRPGAGRAGRSRCCALSPARRPRPLRWPRRCMAAIDERARPTGSSSRWRSRAPGPAAAPCR